MIDEIKKLLDTIIKQQEGGWVLTENKDDPDGGWTYAGVAHSLFKQYDRSVVGMKYKDVLEELKTMKWRTDYDEMVYHIYEVEFVSRLKLDQLPEPIRGPLLSCAINVGVAQAVKILQCSINKLSNMWIHKRPPAYLKEDGQMGPMTIAAYKICCTPEGMYDPTERHGQEHVIESFLREWMRYYINITQENAEAWRDYCEAIYTTHISERMKKPPATLRATQLEGWFNRVEFWR